jgi:hypothetical protein
MTGYVEHTGQMSKTLKKYTILKKKSQIEV